MSSLNKSNPIQSFTINGFEDVIFEIMVICWDLNDLAETLKRFWWFRLVSWSVDRLQSIACCKYYPLLVTTLGLPSPRNSLWWLVCHLITKLSWFITTKYHWVLSITWIPISYVWFCFRNYCYIIKKISYHRNPSFCLKRTFIIHIAGLLHMNTYMTCNIIAWYSKMHKFKQNLKFCQDSDGIFNE